MHTKNIWFEYMQPWLYLDELNERLRSPIVNVFGKLRFANDLGGRIAKFIADMSAATCPDHGIGICIKRTSHNFSSYGH